MQKTHSHCGGNSLSSSTRILFRKCRNQVQIYKKTFLITTQILSLSDVLIITVTNTFCGYKFRQQHLKIRTNNAASQLMVGDSDSSTESGSKWVVSTRMREAVMVQGCANMLPPPAGTSSPHCLMTDIQSLPVPLLCEPLFCRSSFITDPVHLTRCLKSSNKLI